MLIVADVHGRFDALGTLARSGESLLILGDLINFVDYRTMDGIAAAVLGKDFVKQVARVRAVGDYEGSRALWREHMAGRESDIRRQIGEQVHHQYEETRRALEGGVSYVTYGTSTHRKRCAPASPPVRPLWMVRLLRSKDSVSASSEEGHRLHLALSVRCRKKPWPPNWIASARSKSCVRMYRRRFLPSAPTSLPAGRRETQRRSSGI
ncbi:MAG: hypothetical protein ACXW15_10400 [Acidimicrobiia bacterium]